LRRFLQGATIVDIADEIVFELGAGRDAVRLGYEDFDLMENPIKGRFALAPASC
jgi:hypothetical protein